METEPVPKLMLRFALPAVVGMVAGAIYNIVDRIFVGHYVGPAGLAAITVSFPPMLMTIAFALLICIGGSSRVAILFGAKRIEEAERALASTFVLLGCAGALFIAASLLFADDMLRLAGGTGEVLARTSSCARAAARNTRCVRRSSARSRTSRSTRSSSSR